jgi:hypothetical protein
MIFSPQNIMIYIHDIYIIDTLLPTLIPTQAKGRLSERCYNITTALEEN